MGLFGFLGRKLPEAWRTGHEPGDLTLTEISKVSDLAEPREWIHYLYMPDEDSARTAIDVLVEQGWSAEFNTVDGVCVVATQQDVVLRPEVVRQARALFERLAADLGGEYDGWEASA